MTNEEIKLLDNILDSLDRLFDRESRLVDIHTLIFATSKALSKTQHLSILNETCNNLEQIASLNLNADNETVEALKATDKLRHYLAKILDF